MGKHEMQPAIVEAIAQVFDFTQAVAEWQREQGRQAYRNNQPVWGCAGQMVDGWWEEYAKIHLKGKPLAPIRDGVHVLDGALPAPEDWPTGEALRDVLYSAAQAQPYDQPLTMLDEPGYSEGRWWEG